MSHEPLTIVVIEGSEETLASFTAYAPPRMGEQLQLADRYGPSANHSLYIVDNVRHCVRPAAAGGFYYNIVEVYVSRHA